jgi:uncharacterized protein
VAWLDKNKIVQLTEEYGGEYGINHTKRLLHIISLIGEEMQYDKEVLWVAAYLHDWGGYPKWIINGLDHAKRSKQIARDFLNSEGFDKNFTGHILECIEFHHGSSEPRSIESKLLSDADAIDFFGVIGVLREFSTKPRELRKAFESAKSRMEKNKKIICFEKSKQIVEQRIKRAEMLLLEFEEESFGYF